MAKNSKTNKQVIGCTDEGRKLIEERVESNGGTLLSSANGKRLGIEYNVISDLKPIPFEGGKPYPGWLCDGLNTRGDQLTLSFNQLTHYSSSKDGNWEWLEGYSSEDAFEFSEPTDTDASIDEANEFVSKTVILIGKKKATRGDYYFYAYAQK